MAEDLLAVAHVVLLSREANEALTARVGRQWSAFNGSVRTYTRGCPLRRQTAITTPC